MMKRIYSQTIITITGDITNHKNVTMNGIDSSNKCIVNCIGGCFETNFI